MRPTVESVLSTIYMSVPVVIVTNNDDREVDLTGDKVIVQDVKDGLNQDIFEDYYVANIDFDSEALYITASPYASDEEDIYLVE